MCKVLPSLSWEQLENGKVIKAIIKAVKEGRVEFVTEILAACPGLHFYLEQEENGRNIFMVAVLHRQDEVFRLLCTSPIKNSIFDILDYDFNSILHMAAMFNPSARRNTVLGAAFLMQREVQWYKVISLTLFYFFNIISMMSCFQFSHGFMINYLTPFENSILNYNLRMRE